MKRLLFSLWRFARYFFFLAAGFTAIGLILVGGAFLQVNQQFEGTGTLPADCAVVFGAAIYGTLPGPAIVRRVSTAAELYRNNQIQTLILSGGRGVGNARSEASVMRREAIDLGVRDEDIILEENSHSTWDNVLYSKNLTSQCSSVVGISDAYHLARIEVIGKRQGWDLKTIPAGNRPPELSEKQSIVRETFGYLYYVLHLDNWITTGSLMQKLQDTSEKPAGCDTYSAMKKLLWCGMLSQCYCAR